MFQGLCKGRFGCGIELKMAQNSVSPFLPWKQDKVGFSERVNDPHEWLHMKAIHFLWWILQVLKPQNVPWPLQGSFRRGFRAKYGPKPSFAILPCIQDKVIFPGRVNDTHEWLGMVVKLRLPFITDIKILYCFIVSLRVFSAVVKS